MSTLTIRKKSLKTWLHVDSVIGDFIISKFYFNADNISFQIVEQGNAKRVIYNISDITLYDDVNGGGAETFSTITQLSLRLEALNYPAFQYDGQIVSIANLITAGSGVTITGSGTLLSPYVISSTGGGGSQSLADVLNVGGRTTEYFLGDWVFQDLDKSYAYLLDETYGAAVDITTTINANVFTTLGTELIMSNISDSYTITIVAGSGVTLRGDNLVVGKNQIARIRHLKTQADNFWDNTWLVEIGNVSVGSQNLQQVSDTGGLSNGSTLKQGTTDAGNGGNKGIALKCSLDYELKWEAGRLYVMEQDGFTIREVSHNFSVTPAVTDDTTKGFVIGSRWILDNGDLYVCTDATTGSAVWNLISNALPTLQQILDNNHDLISGINLQGTNAGGGNTGVGINAFGTNAGSNNQGNRVNFLGTESGSNNTKDNVNALGYQAANGNTFKNVNAFGFQATADSDNQNIFSKWISGVTKYLGRLSFNNITADRKWELPDASGTIALTSDINTPSLQEVLTEGNTATDLEINLDNTIDSDTSTINSRYIEFNDGVNASNLDKNSLGVGDATDLSIYSAKGISHKIGFNRVDVEYEAPTGTTGKIILKDVGNTTKTVAFTSDIPANGLPSGGTAGQILTKVDATNYNATWQENYADWTSVVKHTVKNDGTSLITKGTAVYVTGSNGTNMLVGKASNTSEATSSKTMGLMQSDITTTGGTQTGFVITEGLLSGLNTAGTTAGDPVWLGVNGALIYGLASKPYAPAHLVFIGIVTKVSSGSGEIFIKQQNGFELKEIHDVDLISNAPTNNQGLIFETSSGLWKNKTIDKTLVGLANVDNTSDVNKPISSLTQTALNGKQQDLFDFIDNGIIVYDDYISTSYVSGSTNWNQNSGSNSSGNSLSGAQGTQICTTGILTVGGGGTTLGDVNAGNFFIGNGAWSYKRRVYIPTLSTATERYVIFDGFQAGSSFVNATNMVGFIYDEGGTYATGVSAGSPNWKCFTINGGVRTITTTSTAVASATWTKLRIEINAAGTSVGFYVDNVLVATHTTNIPASTTALHQGNFIVKSAGTTARTYVSDYISIKQILTTSR